MCVMYRLLNLNIMNAFKWIHTKGYVYIQGFFFFFFFFLRYLWAHDIWQLYHLMYRLVNMNITNAFKWIQSKGYVYLSFLFVCLFVLFCFGFNYFFLFSFLSFFFPFSFFFFFFFLRHPILHNIFTIHVIQKQSTIMIIEMLIYTTGLFGEYSSFINCIKQNCSKTKYLPS